LVKTISQDSFKKTNPKIIKNKYNTLQHSVEKESFDEANLNVNKKLECIKIRTSELLNKFSEQLAFFHKNTPTK
jgi:hypothetical protein